MSIGLFLHFARLRLRERMEYRAAFLLGVLSNWISYAGSYVGFYLLLQRFHTIGGWTWSQVVFLFSLNVFTYAIAASCTVHLVNDLESMIAMGLSLSSGRNATSPPITTRQSPSKEPDNKAISYRRTRHHIIFVIWDLFRVYERAARVNGA